MSGNQEREGRKDRMTCSSHLLLLFFTCLSVSLCTAATGKCFRASVVEHICIGEEELLDEQNPLKNIRKNLQAYDEAAERAVGEHAVIIVFPEEGTFHSGPTSNPNHTLRDAVRLFLAEGHS